MSENPERGHLETERLSRLLDEPGSDPRATAHLEACGECRGEFERLSRVRMALSALGELEPPPGHWERIEAKLRVRRTLPPSGGEPEAWRLPPPWTRRAGQLAAAIVLFAGGLAAGLYVTAARDGASVAAIPRDSPGAPGASEVDYLEALGDLAGLREPGLAGGAGEGPLDPVEAAERLARLEALIRATREALESAPGDPVANGLLFQLVDERDFLAGRLNQSLRLAALEYR